MTESSVATTGRGKGRRPGETSAGFDAKCRALTDAMERIGTRLRVALMADGNAEPFLIHASYEIDSRMHVYGQAETETAITDALRASGSTCREFLNEAAETARRLSTPQTPLPVVWDEPALVIAGISTGTVARWRHRRDDRVDPAGGKP